MKAMLLAAGRGERLRPLTDEIPKALVAVRGKPLVVHLIEALARAGIRELVINHAHLGDRIEAALGDGRRFGVAIRYSPESPALETAGGIARALALLGTDPFIAAASDIFCDYDFASLAARALGADLAHLVLVPNPPHHPEGDFALAGARAALSGGPRYTFAGIGLYRPELFARIAPGTAAPLAPLLRDAIAAGRVSAELHRGLWHDVGTPERLAALERSS